VNSKIDDIFNSLKNKSVSSGVAKNFEYIRNIRKSFDRKNKSSLTDVDFYEYAEKIANNANVISSSLKSSFPENNDLLSKSEDLMVLWREIKGIVSSRKVVLEGDMKTKSIGNLEPVESNILALEERVGRLDVSHKNQLSENQEKISKLSNDVKNLDDSYKEHMASLKVLYKEAESDLERKKNDINDLVGEIASDAVAKDYEKSADSEGDLANTMRRYSLIFMGIVSIVFAYLFVETIFLDFNFKSSLFKLIAGSFISIPAAYLARESTRHRQQQYQYLATSLDLRAITPYLDSIPEEERHKVKIEIANRLFAQKNSYKTDDENISIKSLETLVGSIEKIVEKILPKK